MRREEDVVLDFLRDNVGDNLCSDHLQLLVSVADGAMSTGTGSVFQ